MTQSVMLYVYNSFTINSAFERFIKDTERDEFKQHIYLELMSLKGDKLIKSYQEGWIDLLVYRMMKNQYQSKNSPWAKKVRDSNNVELDENYIDIDDNSKICPTKFRIEVSRILEGRKWDKHDFLKKQYHNVLFKMYFWEKRTYKEIESLTGVKSTTVRASVQDSIEYIKRNIKLDNILE